MTRVEQLESALRTLAGCLPDRVYVYGAYGERWSGWEPDTDEFADEFETVDFKELLGGE